MRDVAHMEDHIGERHFFERRAEGGDEQGRQIGNEPTVSDSSALPRGQPDLPQGRVERRKQHILGQDRRW